MEGNDERGRGREGQMKKVMSVNLQSLLHTATRGTPCRALETAG